MKILHVIDVLAPVGGAQIYVRATAEMLATGGHVVAVLHGDPDAVAIPGVTTASYAASGVDRWLADVDPDVVHLHGVALPPYLERSLETYPIVYSLHNFGFACASGSKYFRNGRPCSRPHGAGCFVGFLGGCNHRLDPRPFVASYGRIGHQLPTLRSSKSVVVHGDFMRSAALANGFQDANVRVVPYYVARPVEPPEPAPGRTVTFAGRVVADKGLDVLLEALASCQDSWERLLVAGDGWDRDRCARIARSRGIDTKVSFLGHVDGATVRGALRTARVVVVPSRWPEPFGIVGLEAMAQGRPVVASRVGGIPEWLDDGETGLMVPPGDARALASALMSLLDDTESADAMGLEGWRRVVRFSPEDHLRKLVSVYERSADTRQEAVAEARAS